MAQKNERRTDRGAPGKGHGTYFIDMMRDWTGGRLQMVPTDTQLVCPARQSKLRRGFWIRCLRARTRVRTVPSGAEGGEQPARRPPQRPACSQDKSLEGAVGSQQQEQKSKATMIPGPRYCSRQAGRKWERYPASRSGPGMQPRRWEPASLLGPTDRSVLRS